MSLAEHMDYDILSIRQTTDCESPAAGHDFGLLHRSDTQMLARLILAIRAARPAMTMRARAIVEAIVLSHGSIGSAESVARALGFTNRFRLARFLHTEGLPRCTG